MALPTPRTIFGVHSFCPYIPSTYVPYGIVKVLGSSSLSLTGENIKLMGGSNSYPWAVEDGATTAEMSLKVREYPDFLFTLFLGSTPTANAAETAGNVSTLTNKNGTSVVNATTGIATAVVIPSTGAVDLKFGKYVVVCVGAATVDVYAYSDVDFLRDTDASFEDDTLSVFSAQTITTGGNLDLTSIGVRLTGGSGTIGMTTGNTATFEVRPINSKSMTCTVGATGSTKPEFGAIVMAQKKGTAEMFEVDLFRCKGTGLPLGFDEFKWSEAEIKIDAFYDSTVNGVFSIRNVSPTTVV